MSPAMITEAHTHTCLVPTDTMRAALGPSKGLQRTVITIAGQVKDSHRHVLGTTLLRTRCASA